MKEAIQNYLDTYKNICPNITDKELEFIEAHVAINQMPKRKFYLEEGSVQKEMGFVTKGLLRSYYVNNNGEEVTIGFIAENQYASDYPSFIFQKPSNYFIQSLEPTVMINLPYQSIQEAYAKYKNFETYGRLIAENILVQKEIRIRSFLFQSAEERYLTFIAQQPDLHNRVSLTYLSSFLGIKRQSLSRIRKKIAQQ